MLSGACRRVLRPSTSVRYSRRQGIHGPRGLVSRKQRLLSSASRANGAALAVEPEHLRNIAIIAHVDHGKTTLVDKLLQACNTEGKDGGVDRLLDNNDLERERGITIMSKVTRLTWGPHVLNVVDTPGHADFGGEVERVLSMVDAVLLVVDATEGPMSQTKFVLTKALAAGLRPMVVLNKVDRDSARLSGEVENEIFDLFVQLGADDDQMEYSTLYASGKQGWATEDLDEAISWCKTPPEPSMRFLLDHITETVRPPYDASALSEPFAMAVNNIGSDKYLGRLATGKIVSGVVEVGMPVKTLGRLGGGEQTGPHKVAELFVTRGVTREPLGTSAAGAGDIITLAGADCCVGDTIACAAEGREDPLPTPGVAPPTLAMVFGVNTGPLGGREGTHMTASKIKNRLNFETENNVTILVNKVSSDPDKAEVLGRGELQLGILIENMRREGYEFCVSPPRVLTTEDEEGNKLEPVEEVTVDVDSEHTGVVIDKLTGSRRGVMMEMKDAHEGKTRLIFEVPSRGLMGFGAEIRQETHGSAVVNSTFAHSAPFMSNLGGLSPGKLVATANGKCTAHALASLQDRGKLFISTGQEVYNGMVIGEHARPGDLEVNPCKLKKVTNVRSVLADESFKIAPPVNLGTEELIAYMGEDEMLEVTPVAIRLRKAALDAGERQRLQRSKKKQK
ncbi:unnamed protein product [Pylaiella littoralis]